MHPNFTFKLVMKDFQFITSQHPQFIENLYRDFLKNPSNVDERYKNFFEGFDFAFDSYKNGNTFLEASPNISIESNWEKELSVYRMIMGYREKGHLIAKTNPIRKRKDRKANLQLSHFGLAEIDLDKNFHSGNFLGLGKSSLRKIIAHLEKCYTNQVGFETQYIHDKEKLEWLTNEIEINFHQQFSIEKQKRILEKLNQGVIFEKFLHTKYVGQKRFSLEGGETTIAALDAIINCAAAQEVQEVVIGMAHRGRLNVLTNIMGKTYEQIFSEFEGTAKLDQTMGSGDVKYHMGFGSELKTVDGKNIYLKLMPNPSHLEAVNPVVVGFSRAKADVLYESDFGKILPILIHGDASIAGQGIVYEVLQMSNLDGYYAGGIIHFIINNQIGFTTDFDDARSSDYCTSIAATIQAPVFHVNGDDAEAVVKCVEIATRYRQKFHSDIFIDMVCYRRHGHNEGDDPKFTQPKLYKLIEKHLNPREVYTKYLMENGEPDAQHLATEMEKKFWTDLQERLSDVKQNPLPYHYQQPELWWKRLRKATAEDFEQSPKTGIAKEKLVEIFYSILKWPATFKPLRKIEKILNDKINLFEKEQKIDWATAELIAFGSLVSENKDVRMSGQDVKRGTFSHRHAVLRDENTDEVFNRINNIANTNGEFRIYNSLLSEFGVLGFEYGYSLANPNVLVIWEAQFGDFNNGAQTIIDQFITSGEQKWGRMNGVTLLMPHGYEGQGPEHSSARMERFLQMCAELNMVVTNITTAANYFHALRRQMIWQFRKPLFNFSPKANLRHAGSYSIVDEFVDGKFEEVIDDNWIDSKEVKKVLFCSGKIYFDLFEKQQIEKRKDVAIIRLEQLYPLPTKQIASLHKKYNKANWFWVQEEPLNMGAASFLKINLSEINFGIISRKATAATATGHNKVHIQEQIKIIETAFSL